jgi:hypothetical protein
VTNELCTDCSVYLDEITVLKEKYSFMVVELDVLRVELDEMKSRPSLLGACTSCPILHEKLDVSLVYARSLGAQLKGPIPTSCSTCEINVVKNMEIAHYVDHLQDENDELRKMMGWLSGHEPQLRIMIETYKRQDGEALGANKVGEGSVENEGKIGDITEPPETHHKMPLFLGQIILGIDSTQPQLHPCFLHIPMTSRKPSTSRVTWEMSSLERNERNRVRRSQSQREPKTKAKTKTLPL